MKISKGLYDVLVSEKISIEDKIGAVERFAWPVNHLTGQHGGLIERGEITKEDADLLIEALETNNFKVIRYLKNAPIELFGDDI